MGPLAPVISQSRRRRILDSKTIEKTEVAWGGGLWYLKIFRLYFGEWGEVSLKKPKVKLLKMY